MVQWVLIFTVGLCAGFILHRPEPPPDCPTPPPQRSCHAIPACNANLDLVQAAEMLQREARICFKDKDNLTDQLESCRREATDLENQVNDWRDRYYQSQ
jgi:hypothetical protein